MTAVEPNGRCSAASSSTQTNCGGRSHPGAASAAPAGARRGARRPPRPAGCGGRRRPRPGRTRPSLQEAVHELDLERADVRGGTLQPDVGLEPAGQHVAEVVPPAGDAGVPGQPQGGGAFGVVGDAVEREQVLHVAGLETDPAQLHPADFGLGGPDRVPGASRVTPRASRNLLSCDPSRMRRTIEPLELFTPFAAPRSLPADSAAIPISPPPLLEGKCAIPALRCVRSRLHTIESLSCTCICPCICCEHWEPWGRAQVDSPVRKLAAWVALWRPHQAG